MHVVDTSGWIEYLQDTHRADLFAAAIEERAHLLVPTTALFEVHRVLSRSLPADVVNRCLDVMRLGRVLGLTDARALAASNIAARHKLAMADVAMYSTALEFGATFWTQDVEYQGLPGVRYQAKTAALFGCWAGLQAQAKFFESTSSLANACLASLRPKNRALSRFFKYSGGP